MARGSTHAVDHAALGEPLQQRVDVGQVRRSLLTHDGLAAPVGVDAHECLEEPSLAAIGGEQVSLDVLAWDLVREPAPVGAEFTQSRSSLQSIGIDELDQRTHVAVIAQVAQAAEVVARPLPGQQVAQVVTLSGDTDAAVLVEDAAHQRGAAAADTHDEDGFWLAFEPGRSIHLPTSLASGAGRAVLATPRSGSSPATTSAGSSLASHKQKRGHRRSGGSVRRSR